MCTVPEKCSHKKLIFLFSCSFKKKKKNQMIFPKLFNSKIVVSSLIFEKKCS
jgi:hypothetical protein